MVALVSIAAIAGLRRAGSETVTYALSVGDTFTSGQTVNVKNGEETVATITYGETGGADFNAAKADANVEGFTALTEGNGTNGNKTGGTFYTIVPNYDGTVEIAVMLNADKAFYVLEDGTALENYNGITVTAKYYGIYNFAVSAGKAYKIYCAGSKLGFYGFKYTYTTGDSKAEVANIAALNALANQTEFVFNGTATVQVLQKKGTQTYCYIKDETGSSLIFDKNSDLTAALTVGKKIAAGWEGAVSVYNGLFEAVPAAALTATEDAAVEPTFDEATLADVTAANVNKIVKLTDVTIASVNGNNFNIKKGDVTVAGYNQFAVEGLANGLVCSEVIGAIGIYGENVQFQPISFTVGTPAPEPADVEISPASGDIYAALDEATALRAAKNITINLTAGAAYTLSATLTAPNNITLKGDAANPAVITMAEGMTGNVITLNGTTVYAKKSETEDSDHKLISAVEISGVKILGLGAALVKDNEKALVEKLTIADAVIEMPAAGKNVLDFSGKGYVGEVVVKNSTIYAKDKNTGFFAQYGSRPKNINGEWLQQFNVQNSTIVNIANGKNFCDLKQNGTAQNVYTLKNNIFVDCGKNGQVVVGFNKGQASATPVWDVDGNIFNAGGEDKSAAEVEKAGKRTVGEGEAQITEDIVKNTIAGVVTFTNAAEGDFGGKIALPIGAAVPEAKVGDPRWNVAYKESGAILWNNEEPATIVWDQANITIPAEKFANAKVGDVMHVMLQDVKVGTNTWEAQVELRGQNWKALEGAAFVAGTESAAAATSADFVLTGDILAIAKAQGVQINGTDCKTALITLEYADEVAGSDLSIWVGSATKALVGINKAHFANSNLFGGVKVGDKIRVTVKKTDAEKGCWIGMNYNNTSWQWSDFAEGSFAATSKETADGAIVEFEVKTEAAAKILNEDNVSVIVNNPDQTVTQVELIVAPVDVVLEATDITDGNITTALAAKTASIAKVGNITINLAAGVTYTVSSTIEVPADLTINGNGATIDAAALEANLIQWKAKEDTEWTKSDVNITGVSVKGLKKALFYSNSKFYYGNFTLINSLIELAADVTAFDYTKGSVALNFTVAGSTIYATEATTKSLYSSQSGQKATEYNGDAKQEFIFSLNTMYNLTKGKNFFSHRQSNQKWLTYTVQNNIFVNCGKSGQVIKGMNGGQGGANPTWTISGNLFNFDGADTSANEETGDSDHTGDETPGLNETVQNSVAGVITFTDAAAGNFAGNVELPYGATAPEALGDNRWTLTYTNAPAPLYVISDLNNWDRTALTEMTFNAETQAYEWEIAPTGFFNFAFATKQLTAAEAEADPNWEDFNNNYRYAIAEGDNLATLNEALPLLKINGTIQLKAVKEGTTYKISVAKDLSTVTIAGEAAPEPQPVTVEKLFIMGTGTPGDWSATTELTFNEATQAFEYTATVTGDTYLTFGDAAFTTWDEFNGKHRFAPAEGNTDAVLDQATQLILVQDGCVVLKTPGTYKISVTKNLVMTVTADATGINSIAADKLDNAVIYNLKGQRVDKANAKSGLYIVNGNKVVIK